MALHPKALSLILMSADLTLYHTEQHQEVPKSAYWQGQENKSWSVSLKNHTMFPVFRMNLLAAS